MPASSAPSTGRSLARSTAIAAVISVPSVAVFLAAWVILDSVIYAAVIGGFVHIMAMGFAFKVSKKMFGGDRAVGS